ncbi:MAG: hypothetical protein M1834_007740 [Cirrosporium novae-zelandiae]|nr:MAG: hypothetical protein M1834_007740 [Cirrosporium novae-zelandiae]
MAQPLTDREKFPEFYVEDQNIDRRTCKRQIPLQVLSLGMSRTGTMSIRAALYILGYKKPCHAFTFFENPRDFDLWTEYIKAKFGPPGCTKYPIPGRVEFDQILGDCDATTDMPTNLFGPELVAAYPDAKVILVERDIDRWADSISKAIFPVLFTRLWIYIGYLDYHNLGRCLTCLRTWGRLYFHATAMDEATHNAKATYLRHYSEIRAATPPDRLLDYKFSDGWEPLCKFLGKPIPDVPFPRANDAQEMQDRLTVVLKRAVIKGVRRLAWLGSPMVVLGIATLGYRYGYGAKVVESVKEWQ